MKLPFWIIWNRKKDMMAVPKSQSFNTLLVPLAVLQPPGKCSLTTCLQSSRNGSFGGQASSCSFSDQSSLTSYFFRTYQTLSEKGWYCSTSAVHSLPLPKEMACSPPGCLCIHFVKSNFLPCTTQWLGSIFSWDRSLPPSFALAVSREVSVSSDSELREAVLF